MKRSVRIGLGVAVVAAALGVAAFFWFSSREEEALPLPRAGDQEIAWIDAATGGAAWERFIDGIRYLESSAFGRQMALQVDTTRSATVQEPDVPEVGLRVGGCGNTLWIRWYKLTGDIREEKWIKALAKRDPPPLAIIGGSSSDRAKALALKLAEQKSWKGHGQRPLLLLTTATADNVVVDATTRPLISLYEDRTFRFCFTNRQMAEALMHFVDSQPELRPVGDMPVVAGMRWEDDPYSVDLYNQLLGASQKLWPAIEIYPKQVPHSVGDYAVPNSREEAAVQSLSSVPEFQRPEPILLLLPTVEKPARRVLRTFATTSQELASRLVVVTGDSLSFNTVYRDRNLGWRIQELPVTLLLFRHENPIPASAMPFRPEHELHRLGGLAPGMLAPLHALWPDYSEESARDDLLLNARIAQMVLQSAYQGSDEQRTLISGSDEFKTRLRDLKHEDTPFFDPQGNRQGGSGEYVVCLRPLRSDHRVLPLALLDVWTWRAARPSSRGDSPRQWAAERTMLLGYGDGRAAP
jgi:hypothetical protein